MGPRTEKNKKTNFFSVSRLVTLGLAGLVALMSYYPQTFGLDRYLSKLQWLTIREVVIQAEWPLNSDRIRKWIPSLEGRSILLADASEMMSSLGKRPWVKSVSVKKQYPDRIFISVGAITAKAIALWHGKTYFMDGDGHLIEKVEPSVSQGNDLPVVAWDGQEEDSRWKMTEIFRLLQSVNDNLGKSKVVSEVSLRSYPNVRFFLSSTRLEILFNIENWSSQIPRLALLVQNPPPEVGSIHRINLTIPKKAVVSASLSN